MLQVQLTFHLFRRKSPCRFQKPLFSKIYILQIIQVLRNCLTGIKGLGAPRAFGKVFQALFKLRTQTNG